MSHASDATPFSIDNILGTELSESHEKYYHQRAKKLRKNNLMYGRRTFTSVESETLNEEQKFFHQRENYYIGRNSTFCDDDPHSPNYDAIEREIAKRKHEFLRNYSFSPYSLAGGVGLSKSNIKSSHPKYMTSHQVQQADKADIAKENGATRENLKPPSCSVGGITVTLENSELWQTFNKCGTEMILNRSGRRMFPYVSVRVEGMDPAACYSVKIDIRSEDDRRYKFINSKWIPVGLADPEIANTSKHHVDSPNSGAHWMKNEISFAKLKITNNKETKAAKQVLLHSMHKYKPCIVVTKEPKKDNTALSEALHFSFDMTSFIAVTAYQNENITQLKIHNNPFAKAFRDTDVTAIIEGACMLTGSPSAAFKALYGNEQDLSFRSSMPLHNMPPNGTRINENKLRRIGAERYYHDQRAKMWQEKSHQIYPSHRDDCYNSIYNYPDYFASHQKIPFHQHSYNTSPFIPPGLRSIPIHASTPYESDFYHNHWNHNRVKRFNQEIGEWFDLNRSNSKLTTAGEQLVKSETFDEQCEKGVQPKPNKERTENAVSETKYAENNANEGQDEDNLKLSYSDSDLDDRPTLVQNSMVRDGTHMLRVPTFPAGIPGKSCKRFPNYNPQMPLDLVKRKKLRTKLNDDQIDNTHFLLSESHPM
ncbi:eomesodermin-like [Anneissia japonica]|uniref:eomesodermin-like n=1 Tax=Anneissia japonica TaxID=1529436 RepID=UPI0014256A37|nr:eomesodermin-like [Anneissia japonica]